MINKKVIGQSGRKLGLKVREKVEKCSICNIGSEGPDSER